MLKKVLLIHLLMVSTRIFSQDFGAASLRLSSNFVDNKTYFGPGASFQFQFFKIVTAGLNTDILFGKSKSYLLKFEPRLDFYFKNGFNGLHTGINTSIYFSNKDIATPNVDTLLIALGIPDPAGGSNIASGIGLNFGYTKLISKKYFLDFTTHFELLQSNSFAVDDNKLIIKPVLSFGILFK